MSHAPPVQAERQGDALPLRTPPSLHRALTLAEDPRPVQAEQQGGAQLPGRSALLLPLPLQDARTIQTAVAASIVTAVTIQVPVIISTIGAVIIAVIVLTTGPFLVPQPDAGCL